MSTPVLNRRLTLEEPARVPDGAGGFTQTWITVGVLWAAVQPGSGRERDGEYVTLSRVPYRIVVRGAPQGAPSRPRPEQRFRDGARIFRILAVSERDARGHYLNCFAEEEVGA